MRGFRISKTFEYENLPNTAAGAGGYRLRAGRSAWQFVRVALQNHAAAGMGLDQPSYVSLRVLPSGVMQWQATQWFGSISMSFGVGALHVSQR